VVEGALGRGRIEGAWCHSLRKGKELCSMEEGRTMDGGSRER